MKVQRSNGRRSQKQKQRAKKQQATPRSSAWTKQGEQPGRHLVAKRAGEHGNNDKNLESALARSLKLQSELEAMKRDLRESEDRVQELLALDGFGGGIVARAELNTLSDASVSADLHQVWRETQHDVLSRPSSPEAKTGDFGSEHDDDVEVQKAVHFAAQTEKILSMAAASKKLAAEKLRGKSRTSEKSGRAN